MDRRNVVALAWRPGEGHAALSGGEPRREIGRWGWRPQWMEQTHRLAPVAHGAGGVYRHGGAKCVAGALVPERVQQRDPALEVALRLRSTRRGERDAAQRLAVRGLVLVFLGGEGDGSG